MGGVTLSKKERIKRKLEWRDQRPKSSFKALRFAGLNWNTGMTLSRS